MLPTSTSRIAARVVARPRVDGATLFLAASVVIGAVVRARPVFVADFPLNDGGMFLSAIRDVERDIVPATLSYNGLDLPFAYPPLAFFAAAIANGLGLALTDVLRVLPWLFASLTVVAFARLSRTLLRDAWLAAIATFAFAVTPAAYTWLVMGGGLTRGLGLCFALVALERVAAYLDTRSRAALLGVSVASALALLTHLEMAWVVIFSAALLWAWRARDRRSFIALAGSGLGALALVSPWAAIVISRHGVGPFLAAAGTGALDNPVVDLAIFRQTSEPWFAIVAALAALGAVRAIGRAEYALPLWVVAIGLLDSRSFGIVSAAPMAMLAAIAVRDVVVPLVTGPRARVALAGAAATYALLAVTQASTELLRPLPAADRDAMEWARAATPADATFLVVTERGWAENAPGEWFPALAARRSISTVQGYEWLPDRAFWRQMRLFFAAQSCGSQDAACLDALRTDWNARFDYVYLPAATLEMRQDSTWAPCCGALREALLRDARYDLVYAKGGAFVFRAR